MIVVMGHTLVYILCQVTMPSSKAPFIPRKVEPIDPINSLSAVEVGTGSWQLFFAHVATAWVNVASVSIW